MKSYIYLLATLVILVSCKEKKAITDAEGKKINSSKEWIALFDGTSLDNWRGYLSEEIHSEWSIDDGAMLFTPGGKGGKNIITKQKFNSFILSFKLS